MQTIIKRPFFVMTFLAAASYAFLAQSPSTAPAAEALQKTGHESELRERRTAAFDENTLAIISGNIDSGEVRISSDIVAVLYSSDSPRVLPVIGRGSMQNMWDLLSLKGIDVALVDLAALAAFKKNTPAGGRLQSRLAYITSLFHDELHLLVRPEIRDIRDLQGKRVNFSNAGYGPAMPSGTIFEALGIEVEGVSVSQADAIEMMKRGELDASLCTCIKPLASYQTVPNGPGFRLIPIPYDERLYQHYLPTTLDHDDYPDLIPAGRTVETVAIQTLLAVVNWPRDHPRYRKLARFTHAFFENFEKFVQPPRHPRWRTVNLAARIPGWRRFPAAQEWLDAKLHGKMSSKAENGVRTALEAAMPGPADLDEPDGLKKEEREELFTSFTRWLDTMQTGAQQ